MQFAFVQMNDIMKVVKEFGLKIKSQAFDNQCTMVLEFRKKMTAQVLGKLEKIDHITVNWIATI